MTKSVRDSMAAAAFAEEGEFETARQLMQQSDKAAKKVILSVDELEIKPKLIDYALDLCQRVGGQLEVFQILKPSMVEKAAQSLLNPIVEKLTNMGIKYELAFGRGKLEDELIKHAEGRRNILFVLLKSFAKNGKQNNADNINVVRIMNKLKCPVVVFSDKT